MSILSRVKGVIGDSSVEEDEEEPTHVCEDCGEQYFGESRVTSCRGCGGMNVKEV